MPIYEYLCPNCHSINERVGGLDDHTAYGCDECGGDDLIRLDDPLAPPVLDPDCSWCVGPEPGPPVKSHKMCARHAAEFMREVP